MTHVLPASILQRFDAGEKPSAIAVAEGCSLAGVYNVLRAARPARKRAPREKTGGDKTTLVLGLAAQGIKPARIAFLARCSRAYVYRLISGG